MARGSRTMRSPAPRGSAPGCRGCGRRGAASSRPSAACPRAPPKPAEGLEPGVGALAAARRLGPQVRGGEPARVGVAAVAVGAVAERPEVVLALPWPRRGRAGPRRLRGELHPQVVEIVGLAGDVDVGMVVQHRAHQRGAAARGADHEDRAGVGVAHGARSRGRHRSRAPRALVSCRHSSRAPRSRRELSS